MSKSFLAAFAALFLTSVAQADTQGTEEADPCTTCTPPKVHKKPAPKPDTVAPVPDSGKGEVVNPVTPPPVGNTIINITQEAEPVIGANVHCGLFGGLSGGSWPVARDVLDRRYHDSVLAGEALGGAYVLFGAAHPGSPYGGVHGGFGAGSIDSFSGSGGVDFGAMLSDRVGFGGTGEVFFRNYDWHDREWAAQYLAGSIGPEVIGRLDDPDGADPFEVWGVGSVTGGAGGFVSYPDLFGHLTANVSIRVGLDFSKKN